MHREKNMAAEISMVPDKIRDQYQEQLDAQSLEIAYLKDGIVKICQLLEANQKAPFVATTVAAPAAPAVHAAITIPKISAQPVVPTVVHGDITIPKVTMPMTETGEKLPPADYYRFLITQAKKHNAYGKNGQQYKGVHAVISGINESVKEYYGKDTDVVKLTQTLAERGIIAMRMVKRGPMLYLPEDFAVSPAGYINL